MDELLRKNVQRTKVLLDAVAVLSTAAKDASNILMEPLGREMATSKTTQAILDCVACLCNGMREASVLMEEIDSGHGEVN